MIKTDVMKAAGRTELVNELRVIMMCSTNFMFRKDRCDSQSICERYSGNSDESLW